MRKGMLVSGEWIVCYLRKYIKETGDTESVGVRFLAKQTSVADLVAFQTKKGATTEMSSPLTGLDSSDIKFELYTISQLEFNEFDQVDVYIGKRTISYTIKSVSFLMDSTYAIKNARTGRADFPQVIRLN